MVILSGKEATQQLRSHSVAKNWTSLHLHSYTRFITYKSNQEKTCISIDGEKNSIEEQEADSFANSQLIPPVEWQLFKAETEHLSPYAMGPFFRKFSDAFKIHPAIILGRYQHDYKVFDNGRGIERSIN